MYCISTHTNRALPRLQSLMATHGCIFPFTVDSTPSEIPLGPILQKGVRIQGSLVASRQGIKELLEFAAEHQIAPTIMKFPLNKDGIETAISQLQNGKIRAVLVK